MKPAPLNVLTYHVFLASPGDMDEERKEVRRFFELWNRTEGARSRTRYEVVDWENYSSVGVGRPQDLITQQTLERFSRSLVLVIGLMGHHFGSPTGTSESGTEEELSWALDRWRQKRWPEIKLFFRRQHVIELAAEPKVLREAADQLEKVLAFKEKCRTSAPPLYCKEFPAGQFRQSFETDLQAWLSQRPRRRRSLPRKGRTARGPRPVLPKPYGPMPGGKPFKEKITGMRMLWVVGGRFQIGQGRYSDAAWVRLSGFWIGEIPVTNRQYGVFLTHSNHPEPDFWREPRFSDSEQPVVGVSWHDAVAFCRWLSEASGLACSLCSEAQWEYAARGSDGRTYPWGDELPTSKRACYDLDGDKAPTPAGIYPYGRGPFGTLDQTGNVWEWCLDAWRKHAYRLWRGSEPLDPVMVVGRNEGDLEEDPHHVLRGACWSDAEDLLPAALRYHRHASYQAVRVGFRVAVNPAKLDAAE